jgi:nitrous oxidase accessory protein NosD
MTPVSILAVILLAALPALAQNDNSWVASNGSDTYTCLREAPCLTFQHAYDRTNPGGIVKAVDAADYYGTLVVSKAITLDGNGAEIEIGAGTPGIQVLAGPVTIRDLTIHAHAAGIGIYVQSADIDIENVTITGAQSLGVYATGSSGAVHMTAKNLKVTGAASNGILIYGGSASIRDSLPEYHGARHLGTKSSDFPPL